MFQGRGGKHSLIILRDDPQGPYYTKHSLPQGQYFLINSLGSIEGTHPHAENIDNALAMQCNAMQCNAAMLQIGAM